MDIFGYSAAMSISKENLAFRGREVPPECQITTENSRGVSKKIKNNHLFGYDHENRSGEPKNSYVLCSPAGSGEEISRRIRISGPGTSKEASN